MLLRNEKRMSDAEIAIRMGAINAQMRSEIAKRNGTQRNVIADAIYTAAILCALLLFFIAVTYLYVIGDIPFIAFIAAQIAFIIAAWAQFKIFTINLT